jgi:hypothetical protein
MSCRRKPWRARVSGGKPQRMEPWSIFAGKRSGARLGLTLVLGYTLVGCGATGLEWVDQPVSASSATERERIALSNEPVMTSSAHRTEAEITAGADAATVSRPRLNHTVTLGEVEAFPVGEQAAPTAGPSVSVTINNYGGPVTPGAGYGGYYGGYAGFATTRSGSFTRELGRAAVQPGQNWPTVSDHGPSFPYHSLPASPFEVDGRRH